MTVETPRPRFGLQWGIKSSFLDYVTRMPDGRALAGAGVTVNERGELVFPFDEEATSSPETFAFGGDVRFSGHFGLLFVQIALPHIVVRDGVGEMTVLDPGSKDGTRLHLVTLGLTGPRSEDGLDRWEATDVRLTPEGVELFGDVYQVGEPFEPLTITIPRREGSHG